MLKLIKNYFIRVIIVRIVRMKKVYILFKKKAHKMIPYTYRFCRYWLKTYYKYCCNPKKFYKQIPLYFIIAFIWPSKKRFKQLMGWIMYNTGSFYRNSISIAVTFDIYNNNIYYYIKINLIVFFFVKMYQEIFFNFTCPLATLMYGKLKKRKKRQWQIKLEEKEKRKNRHLHKFVADPFITKAQRAKKQALLEKKEAKKSVKYIKLIENNDNFWKFDVFAYRKIDKKKRITMRKKKKWFFF